MGSIYCGQAKCRINGSYIPVTQGLSNLGYLEKPKYHPNTEIIDMQIYHKFFTALKTFDKLEKLKVLLKKFKMFAYGYFEIISNIDVKVADWIVYSFYIFRYLRK